MTRNDGQVYSRESLLARSGEFADVRLVFTGWGTPRLDEDLLMALPSIEAVFHGAGSVRKIATDAFWERDILLTSAYRVNAVPVAQYTVAAIVFALKRAFPFCQSLRCGRPVAMPDRNAVPGVYQGTRVGVISLGAIGSLVCEMLSGYGVDILVYDPYAGANTFHDLHVKPVDTLEELFTCCDVVSLHAPWLRETEGLVTGKLLRLMPRHATFINTARGAIVNEAELFDVLRARPDLYAVLDVICDEECYHQHALTRLPNVFMTPHIAGSKGRESHRMGMTAVEECRRYLNGDPPLCSLNEKESQMLA